LLTIRIRLIVCSLDKAREIGLGWWDHHLSPGRVSAAERDRSACAHHVETSGGAAAAKSPAGVQDPRTTLTPLGVDDAR
jgi:hypothetical protein